MLYPTRKRRMRPFVWCAHMAMFDRVVVNVINMPLVIPLVANRMFPITPLPDTAFAFAFTARRNVFAAINAARETCLDQSPAFGKVIISRWQLPDSMQVFRQHHHGVDRKRLVVHRGSHRFAQVVDVTHQQIVAVTFGEIHREEITTAFNA